MDRVRTRVKVRVYGKRIVTAKYVFILGKRIVII